MEVLENIKWTAYMVSKGSYKWFMTIFDTNSIYMEINMHTK